MFLKGSEIPGCYQRVALDGETFIVTNSAHDYPSREITINRAPLLNVDRSLDLHQTMLISAWVELSGTVYGPPTAQRLNAQSPDFLPA